MWICAQTASQSPPGEDGRATTLERPFSRRRLGTRHLLASKIGIKRSNPSTTERRALRPFRRRRAPAGRDEGNISIFWFEHGWFWLIPLHEGITSVGAVCSPRYLKSRKTVPRTFFWETIALCPQLA